MSICATNGLKPVDPGTLVSETLPTRKKFPHINAYNKQALSAHKLVGRQSQWSDEHLCATDGHQLVDPGTLVSETLTTCKKPTSS